MNIPAIVLIGSLESIRIYSVVIGIAGLIAGILLILIHKRTFDQEMQRNPEPRLRKFETRKYRRRSLVAAMVASAGCMMMALYGVTEVRVFLIFILLITGLLVSILGIAMIDMFSVGLQSITRIEDADHQEFLKEYLRKREQSAKDDSEPEG